MINLILLLAIVYYMYTKKIKTSVIASVLILGYILLVSKEGFALSSGIILDVNTLENDKTYVIGAIDPAKQVTTTTASINGGANCLTFPTTTYKLAEIKDAVCSVPNGTTAAGITTANVDGNYTFPVAGKKGYEIKFGPGTCVSNADVVGSSNGNNGVCRVTNNANTTLKSPNGAFKLVLQDDGHLILYDGNNALAWRTGTFPGAGAGPYKLEMQTDGNLVEYNRSNQAVWATNRTSANGPFRLSVQDDSNVVVYDRNNGVVWARI